jgi:hypothetical protein
MKGVETSVVVFTILAVIIVAAFIVILYLKGAIPISWTYDENSCRNQLLDLCNQIDRGVSAARGKAEELWDTKNCKQWFRAFSDVYSYCTYLLGHPVS